jgi:hypothetical protein
MVQKTLSLACFLLFSAGCGVSTFQPGRGAGFDLEAAKEINDDDVRKAFEARPQLSHPMRVAFYSLDVGKSDDIERSLRQVPGVQDVYRIPPLMVTGQRRFEDPHRPQPSQELSIKKLRLLAARAQADVLVIFDYGNRVETSPNGWVALTPLLLPTFFVPFLDKKVESYLDTYVIDTRNGFLYAHLSSDEKTELGSTRIYHNTDPTLQADWQKILGATRQRLAVLTSPTGSAPQGAPPVPPVASRLPEK